MMIQPKSIQALQQALCEPGCYLPVGGRTKAALSTPPEGVLPLEMEALAGVVAYEPGEFTFTALAGTPISTVDRLLAEHGQYLPFDPLLAKRGATLGGTVAAGCSGPGRYHYGGVRDFLLGVRYVNGAGQVVHGGGNVVKNSAGFDLPKLLTGSLGRLGVLVELTFKVFPRPEAWATLRLNYPAQDEALQALMRLTGSQLDLDALDLEVTPTGTILWARLAGLAGALPPRLDALRRFLGGGEVLLGPEESGVWESVRELTWVPEDWALVKIPLTPGRIPVFEAALKGETSLCRYSGGGQVAWLAWGESLADLSAHLTAQELSGLVLFGPPGQVRLGIYPGEPFARRVKLALDPEQRFPEV